MNLKGFNSVKGEMWVLWNPSNLKNFPLYLSKLRFVILRASLER